MKELTEIYTLVFHFEFEALNAGESIYQSYWIMPCSLLWFLDKYSDSPFTEMVQFAAQENGVIERVSAANRELQKGEQLSIF